MSVGCCQVVFNHSEGISLEECTQQYKVHLKVEKAQKKARSDVWTVSSAGSSDKKDSEWFVTSPTSMGKWTMYCRRKRECCLLLW